MKRREKCSKKKNTENAERAESETETIFISRKKMEAQGKEKDEKKHKVTIPEGKVCMFEVAAETSRGQQRWW